ncbi:MAG: Stp1/IreP family PP2C-type Ser/Thr phosphatase [Bacillota bacterium]
MIVAARTDVGRVREVNEDTYCCRDLPGALLVAVADGIGGHRAGAVASQLAVDEVCRAVAGAYSPGVDAAGLLPDAVKQANRAILQAAGADGECESMGTTLTVALVQGNSICIAHVGDSRAYLIQGDEVSQLTHDHSLVGELYRNGSLTEAEAMSHPHKHILFRALGADEMAEVDLLRVAWAPGDFLVLCSDGLSNLVEASELRAIISRYPPHQAVDRLVALANERGGQDNITVIVVENRLSGERREYGA